MTTPLRVGIIGCGFATRDRHLPAISRIDEVEVVALADLDAAVLADVAGQLRTARRYEDAAALIADPIVEVVTVCVPAAQHVEVGLAAVSYTHLRAHET